MGNCGCLGVDANGTVHVPGCKGEMIPAYDMPVFRVDAVKGMSAEDASIEFELTGNAYKCRKCGLVIQHRRGPYDEVPVRIISCDQESGNHVVEYDVTRTRLRDKP